MSLLFGGKTIFQENTALQIYSYHHYIIVYVIITLTIIKGYFRMKWSSTVWRTISSTGMVRQNNIQKSMNCGFIHHDGRLLIKNTLLHILIGTFMSAVVGRFPAILVSIVVITSIAFVVVLFFAFVVVFIFWIWFFFCFHHSRRRIKWFTRGECFCRQIIWQENCFLSRGPPLTIRLMVMMCQKYFWLLKKSQN